MRTGCCLALAALALTFTAAPASAQQPRAVVVFVPAATDDGLLERFADRSLAVAVTAPTAGGEASVQTYLDLGQGTRVSARVYDAEPPRLRLARGGRLSGWERAVARAEDAPGDVLPGLLGETVRRSGGRTAYVGVAGEPNDEAAAVADAAGEIDTVSLGDRTAFEVRLARVASRHTLTGARLPSRNELAALGRLPDDVLVVAVRAPRRGDVTLLPAALSLRGDLLTSRTTRRDGLVAVTDYAPTILERLGLEVPDEMQGREITAANGSWEDAQSLADRLAHIKGRRGPALRVAFAAWLLVLGGLALAGRARLGLRLGLLSAMWLPGVALLTGALDPSRWTETALLAGGSLALALVTDRLAGWPRAPAVPAAAVLGAHAVDLIAGSPLIVRSLAGPNPGFGARFFGIGNELEAIVAAMLLIGTGAFMAGRRGRAVPIGFAVACTVAAAFVGAGRLGADVGGVITLAAGAAAAVLASLPGGVTRRALALALLAPVAGVGALVLVDVVTGGDAHLTRSVLDADSPGELWDVAERRFDISWDSLRSGTTPISVGVFALALGYGVARRRELLALLEGDRAFEAGMWGALGATVVGALANDSGPTIFLVGAAALVLAAGYMAGKPPEGRLT